MKLNIKIISCMLLGLSLVGCSKDLLNEDAPGTLTADNLYIDKVGFDAGLNGLYNQARRSRSGTDEGGLNDIMLMPAFSGVDNTFGNWRDGWVDVYNLWNEKNSPSAPQFESIWLWCYKTISSANTIINRVDGPKVTLTQAEKNQVLAEAKFIRAWSYRHLTFLFGDVPLLTEEVSGTNIKTDWIRTPVAEIRAKMEEDLKFAAENLEKRCIKSR